MAKTTSGNIGGASAAGERIASIQSRLLDRTLFMGLIVSVVGVAASFNRTPDSGFQIAHITHVSLLGLLAVTVVLRAKIPYRVRYMISAGILIIGGISGLISYGLIGQGSIMILCAVALAPAFTGPRTSYGVLALCTIIIVIVMLLFTRGLLTASFDVIEYYYALSSWITFLVTFAMFTGIVIMVITDLFSTLKSLSEESMKQVAEIQLLNTTLEEKVKLRTAELAQSNKDKDRILGVVAHDINNKLFGILGNLELLTVEYPTLKDKARLDYVRIAAESTVLIGEMVNSILEFATSHGDENAIIMEPVDMGSFVRSSVESHLPRAKKKNVDLRMGETPEFSFCNINKVKLSRVIDNLVTNAIKFTPKGGTVTVEIENHQGDGTMIKVIDTGIGIPDALKPNIFKPFSSSGRAGTEKEESTGLGLSISKEIVKKHSGKIWLESKEDKGSTFFLLFPMAATAESQEDTGYALLPSQKILNLAKIPTQ